MIFGVVKYGDFGVGVVSDGVKEIIFLIFFFLYAGGF